MQFQGTIHITAAQTAVWHTLTNPTIVSQCTPRLKNWKILQTDSQFQLHFAWGSGKSIVLVPLLLTWQTVAPPTHLQWQGQAQMGSTTIPLNGEFYLASPRPTQTDLTFTAEVHTTNKLLAQLVQTSAPPLFESFFNCLKQITEAV